MNKSGICSAAAILLLLAGFGGATIARDLTFEDRVRAQKAIEQVYWNHRIWPRENPQPKPPLSEVMTDDAIRTKVENYLRESNALETWWRRPIAAGQLQAEMDRMAKQSRDPQVLRELFDALGNDPFLIAETLALQTLADKLIRSWYAYDTRFHGDLKKNAEAALAACESVACMKSMGGEYREATVRLRGQETENQAPRGRDGDLLLDPGEWKDLTDRLGTVIGGSPGTLHEGKLSGLEETADAFTVTAVLTQTGTVITTATTVWRKRPFDAWWIAERARFGVDVPSPSVPFSISYGALSACTADTWIQSRAVPARRVYATAIWTGTEMIVWGGNNSHLNTGDRYNPSTDSWMPTSMGPDVPDVGGGHSAVWTGTEMIIWGNNNHDRDLNNGGRYNPTTDTWIPVSFVNAPEPRWSHKAIWTGTEMIVWGGQRPAADTSYFPLNTGGRYNPSSDSWLPTSMGPNLPAARRWHTAVWTGTEMIVWGGRGPDYVNLNTGGRYDPTTDTWRPTSIQSGVPLNRFSHSAVWTGTEMIVWGGMENTLNLSNSGGRYDPATDSWVATSTGANVPEGRYEHPAVWTGTEMIVWGGSTFSYPLQTGGRYNPSTNTWAATSTGANVPDRRQNHTAVWTGSEMIVWGGVSIDQVVFNTGGRYNPSTDTWVPTHLGPPTERTSHTAIWTGTEMIVCGGTTYLSATPANGDRYTPSTDTWLATSSGSNLTLGRRNHTAIWTGTEMVVWGGYVSSSSLYLNGGGRYNPATDTWVATSTGANVPTSRAFHSAVWTGTDMVIWGGDNWPSILNTGGRYSPSADAWVATSTGANVPTPRYRHTAVWTGTEMIVWGGIPDTSSSVLNTGGRYNPSTNTWAATAVGSNLPAARSNHTAVWTGTEMIVWGGMTRIQGSYYNLNTGGRYDPSYDRWTPTSTGDNVPQARSDHSAVWTGTQMIVWGGNGPFNTGGYYLPAADYWRPTTVEGAPTYRSLHTAVWTGDAMIIWGGTPLDGAVGIYCPCTESLPGNPLVRLSKQGCDTAHLTWNADAGSRFDVVRGEVGLLHAYAGDFSLALSGCWASNIPVAVFDDDEVPSMGDGFWYLVRARNCSGTGTYDSGGPGQIRPRDPLIRSGNDCP